MMDCKKALQESNGDLEAAIDFLRKKGQKIAAKRGDRDAKEGLVISKSSGNTGYLICLNCETILLQRTMILETLPMLYLI